MPYSITINYINELEQRTIYSIEVESLKYLEDVIKGLKLYETEYEIKIRKLVK